MKHIDTFESFLEALNPLAAQVEAVLDDIVDNGWDDSKVEDLKVSQQIKDMMADFSNTVEEYHFAKGAEKRSLEKQIDREYDAILKLVK